MYCDKDSNERYSIQDLSRSELEILREALTAYRVNLCNKLRETDETFMLNYIEGKFKLARNIARKIEKTLSNI